MIFSFKRCISSLLCAAVLAGIVPGTVSAETNVSVSSSFRESGMLNSFWSPSLSYEEKTEADNLFSSPEETVIFEESEEAVTLKLPADAEQHPLQFTATYINPLYADVITEEDLVQPSGIALAAEVEYHTTVASAGSAVQPHRSSAASNNKTIRFFKLIVSLPMCSRPLVYSKDNDYFWNLRSDRLHLRPGPSCSSTPRTPHHNRNSSKSHTR